MKRSNNYYGSDARRQVRKDNRYLPLASEKFSSTPPHAKSFRGQASRVKKTREKRARQRNCGKIGCIPRGSIKERASVSRQVNSGASNQGNRSRQIFLQSAVLASSWGSDGAKLAGNRKKKKKNPVSCVPFDEGCVGSQVWKREHIFLASLTHSLPLPGLWWSNGGGELVSNVLFRPGLCWQSLV